MKMKFWFMVGLMLFTMLDSLVKTRFEEVPAI